MQAGKAAGMRTVGVLTGFDEYEILEKENPDAIIDSVQNLLEVIAI
jgi:phosphoglycolate phosphatase